MKKIIAIGMILLLVLLVGCKKTEQAKAPEKVQAAGEEEKIQSVSKSQIKFNIQNAMEGKDDRIKIEPVEPTMEAGVEAEAIEVQ